MKLSDLNFNKSTNYKFRTEYRITLYVKNDRSWKIGFNKESKAKEVFKFLQDLVNSDPMFLNVEMIHKPRVKGNRSFSHMKNKSIACPDLVKLFEPIFNQE